MAKQTNSNLSAAVKRKKDEFYTQLTDIEKEMRYYRKHFRGKTVFCNCDDPYESNFFKYFVLNFNRLGLKKLIATCYAGSPISGSLFDASEITAGDKDKPYKAIVTKVYDTSGTGSIDMLDVAALFKTKENELTELQGNGDFRSEECLQLLDEADIVVTNPPFSLFREYVATLIAHEKKFVIMGNKNAITYKEFFPLLKENKVWVGATPLNGGRWMIIPKKVAVKSNKAKINEKGETLLNIAGVCWFTNLDIKKRHEPLLLIKNMIRKYIRIMIITMPLRFRLSPIYRMIIPVKWGFLLRLWINIIQINLRLSAVSITAKLKTKPMKDMY